jgi:hypothetical protein
MHECTILCVRKEENMTGTRSSEKSDFKYCIIGKRWKKVYGPHAAYGVHKAYVEQGAYGTYAR